MTAADTARDYYAAIDGDDYDRLRGLLAAGFVHDRPDRTIEGRDRFVRFMREERPQTDTEHVVAAVYEHGDEVAVRGRLAGADGERLFGFVDVFYTEESRIERIETYTD